MLKGLRIVLGLGLLLAACWVSAYLAEWWPLTQFIASPAYVFGLRALCVSLLVLLAGSCWGVLFQRAYGHAWLVLLGFVLLMALLWDCRCSHLRAMWPRALLRRCSRLCWLSWQTASSCSMWRHSLQDCRWRVSV